MTRSGSKRSARRFRPLVAPALAAWLLAPLAAAAPAAAQEPAAEAVPAAVAPVEPALIEPTAREAVKRMVETLGNAKRLSYEYESEYDAIQDDGEILEFGSRGAVTIRRPDRLRGEVWHREGRHVRFAWDGQKVAIYDETRNVYATTPRSGDLDSLVDFLRDEVGFKMPLADFFTEGLRQLLIDNVVAARMIGKETLDGVETEHVALRARTGTDAQLWIATGKDAVPVRIVLNFATADGRPQFRAELHDWDLDASARDSAFQLKPPKGVKTVPFALPPKRAAQAAPQEDAQ
jgi:hypothetical protein